MSATTNGGDKRAPPRKQASLFETELVRTQPYSCRPIHLFQGEKIHRSSRQQRVFSGTHTNRCKTFPGSQPNRHLASLQPMSLSVSSSAKCLSISFGIMGDGGGAAGNAVRLLPPTPPPTPSGSAKPLPALLLLGGLLRRFPLAAAPALLGDRRSRGERFFRVPPPPVLLGATPFTFLLVGVAEAEREPVAPPTSLPPPPLPFAAAASSSRCCCRCCWSAAPVLPWRWLCSSMRDSIRRSFRRSNF